MAGDRSALVGLFLFVVVAATPTLLFWAVFSLLPRWYSAFDEWRRSRRAPSGPALESVVADLRRLRREVRGTPPATQMRRVALMAAYDDVLLEACRVVGVPEPPLAAAVGNDRAFARLLTEAALEEAGIALDPPRGDTAAA